MAICKPFSHAGGTGRSGFTLVELLITVTIVGLLAAIGAPRLSRTKDRTYIASMKSDLRNFATYEESHFYDNAIYSSDLGILTSIGFQETNGVNVTIAEATATGWAVTADHNLTDVQCALYSGNAAPVGASTEEGLIACQ